MGRAMLNRYSCVLFLGSLFIILTVYLEYQGHWGSSRYDPGWLALQGT